MRTVVEQPPIPGPRSRGAVRRNPGAAEKGSAALRLGCGRRRPFWRAFKASKPTRGVALMTRTGVLVEHQTWPGGRMTNMRRSKKTQNADPFIAVPRETLYFESLLSLSPLKSSRWNSDLAYEHEHGDWLIDGISSRLPHGSGVNLRYYCSRCPSRQTALTWEVALEPGRPLPELWHRAFQYDRLEQEDVFLPASVADETDNTPTCGVCGDPVKWYRKDKKYGHARPHLRQLTFSCRDKNGVLRDVGEETVVV